MAHIGWDSMPIVMALVDCVTCSIVPWREGYCWTQREPKTIITLVAMGVYPVRPLAETRGPRLTHEVWGSNIMRLRTRSILNNKYRILKRLGSGFFGSTYLAEMIGPPYQKVVVKELGGPRDKSAKCIPQNRSVDRRGIPLLLESFRARDRHYEVFEFVSEAATLHDLLKKRAPLEVGEAISLALQMSEFLKGLHSEGLVHGDIKPSNVLIAPGQQVKLIDFGISARAGTDQVVPVGSVGYAAPEQYHGIISLENDIYSLGVILYQMLTGRKAKGRFSFTPIQKSNPEVPSRLVRLIQRCLDLDRAKRPSMDEIHQTLLGMHQQRGA